MLFQHPQSGTHAVMNANKTLFNTETHKLPPFNHKQPGKQEEQKQWRESRRCSYRTLPFTVLQTSNFYQRRRWQYPSDRFEHRFEHCAELSTGRLTITSNHKARHLSVGALTGTCTASILALRKATAFWRPLTARQVVGDTSTGQGTRSGWQQRPQHDKWD